MGGNASAASYAATASISPLIHYLNDPTGAVFTITVNNTGTSTSIGAVEVSRPTSSWTVVGCPSAPAGWTVQVADPKCRFRSGNPTTDDIPPGGHAQFQMKVTSASGTANRVGTFDVTVSSSNQFDNPSLLLAAAEAPGGLDITAYSFQILDAVVANTAATPGAACPAPNKTAVSGSTHVIVVCGKNRTSISLTPNAANSGLGGDFLSASGTFSSGPIAANSASSVVLGNWTGAHVTNSSGTNKVVVAQIGASANQNSPPTSIGGFTATNQPPDAHDDTATTDEDHATQVNVLANDTDPENDPLTVSAVNTSGTSGTVTITNSGADVRYDPGSAFNYLSVGHSATDTFSYTASDGHGGTDTATVTMTITGVNDPPVAFNDTASANEDGPSVNVNVLANDVDPDASDTLSVTATGGSPQGSVSITGGGTGVSYNPGSAFNHLSVGQTATDSFTYTASDGHGGTSTATVTVTVTGANDPPTAVDDTASTDEDHSAAVNVLANDTDPDTADTLTVIATGGSPQGSVTITGGGTGVSYDPGTAFDHLSVGQTASDSFTYTASDGHGGTSTATVTMTITGVNDPPVAFNDTANTDENAATSIDVLANDIDVDAADTLTITTTGGSPQGSVTITGGGTVVSYDPNGQFDSLNEGQTATDSFTYTISDGHGGTSTATVTVTIHGINAPPTAVDDTFAGALGNTRFAVGASVSGEPVVSIAGSVLANDTDPDSPTLTTTAGTFASAHGSVTMGTDGTFTYLPNVAFTGTDTFSYTVSDGHSNSTGHVSVTVSGPVIWYVDSASGAGTHDGRSPSPFTSLSPLRGTGDADGSGDVIFLYKGTGSYGGGLPLEANQQLVGQGVNLVVAGNTLVTGGPANAPTLTNAGGDGVTLGGGNTIKGLTISGATDNGILGSGVAGLTLSDATVQSNGNATGEDNVRLNNVTGTVSLSNDTISLGRSDNLRVLNTSGTLNLSIGGTTFGANNTTFGEDSVLVQGSSTATVNVDSHGSTYNGARGDQLQLNLLNTASSTLSLNGNTFDNGHPATIAGGGGVTIGGGSGGGNVSMGFTITNNTFSRGKNWDLQVQQVGGTATFTGSISGNTFGTSALAASGSEGDALRVDVQGNGVSRVGITNNAFHHYGEAGIYLVANSGNAQLRTTVTGNTIDNPDASAVAGIVADIGALPSDTAVGCLDLGSLTNVALKNSLAGSDPNGSNDVLLFQDTGGTINLPGYVGLNDGTGVEPFVQLRNNGNGVPTVVAINSLPSGGGFTGTGTDCS